MIKTLKVFFSRTSWQIALVLGMWHFGILFFKVYIIKDLSSKNQASCIERVVHHSHENQKFYLFKIAINEKCQKPKLTVNVIMVAMATAV